jgi:hypothetical protein
MVKGKRMSQFPYGEILPPEPGLFGSPGQNTMCVSEEMLEKIARYRRKVPRLTWEHARRVRLHAGEPVIIKVLLLDGGWWRVTIIH